jgi:acyl carrier protein
MDIQGIRDSIRSIVSEISAMDKGGEEVHINDDDSLIDSGLIDSIGAVQLIEACSMEFDIVIHPAELSIDNFDSVTRITQFIRSKLNGHDE